MKKIVTLLLVLGMLCAIASPLAADEKTGDVEEYDNLVRPSTSEGDVFILGDPDEAGDRDDSGGDEPPLIAPNPNGDEEPLIVPNPNAVSDEDWDGDGIPNEQDACPTVWADTEDGCPVDNPLAENDTTIGIDEEDDEKEEDGPKRPGILALGAIMVCAAVLALGIAKRKWN
ncbi:hypothetical protein EF808_06975 [archaeon]|nr:MAG: hypothetical protein EF808_06975 [archaeon]